MSEYIFDVPDSNQPIAGDTSLYYPDERDEPMMVCEEIVRCRDCKYYHPREGATLNCRFEHPSMPNTVEWCIAEPNGFCAWGELGGE